MQGRGRRRLGGESEVTKWREGGEEKRRMSSCIILVQYYESDKQNQVLIFAHKLKKNLQKLPCTENEITKFITKLLN